MSARTEFVTNAKGQQIAVLLDLKTYQRLRADAEELADIRAYDLARPKVLSEVKRGKFATLSELRRTKALAGKA